MNDWVGKFSLKIKEITMQKQVHYDNTVLIFLDFKRQSCYIVCMPKRNLTLWFNYLFVCLFIFLVMYLLKLAFYIGSDITGQYLMLPFLSCTNQRVKMEVKRHFKSLSVHNLGSNSHVWNSEYFPGIGKIISPVWGDELRTGRLPSSLEELRPSQQPCGWVGLHI